MKKIKRCAFCGHFSRSAGCLNLEPGARFVALPKDLENGKQEAA